MRDLVLSHHLGCWPDGGSQEPGELRVGVIPRTARRTARYAARLRLFRAFVGLNGGHLSGPGFQEPQGGARGLPMKPGGSPSAARASPGRLLGTSNDPRGQPGTEQAKSDEKERAISS